MTLTALSGGMTLDDLRARLSRAGFVEVDELTLDSVAANVEHFVLLPLDNPAQRPEFADLAVILPEVLRQFDGTGVRFEVAFASPPASAALARRFGVFRQPALVFLRHGAQVGAIEGLRDWHEYVQTFARLRDARPGSDTAIGAAP